jgi:cysteine sulfinate desulfinase/cysteine desulfurase-like protein
VGTVQPVEQVAAACTDRGVPLLVDAAQAVGRAPVPGGWSVLTASAHKWGGPTGVGVVGHQVERLPHLLTFSCLYVDGEALLGALDRHGFAVSSGSSCTASTLEPSHVLAAMGLLSSGSLRESLHRGTTAADVDRLLEVLPRVAAEQRGD